MSSDFAVIITSPDGTLRRHLPNELLSNPSWKLERYGNYADCTIPTTIPYDSYLQGLTFADSVQVLDRVDIFFEGSRRYRGYVSGIVRSVAEPYTVTISAYGLSQRVGKLPVDKRYAFAGDGVDIATVFGVVARDFALSGNADDGGIASLQSIQTIPVGITTNTLDASNSSFSQTVSTLINASANLAVWGCGVEQSPGDDPTEFNSPDTVFIKPLPSSPTSADHVIFAQDPQTESATAELQTADIYNVVKITGGPPQFPNLLYNGSFELPVPQFDQAGNWIKNGSFEDGPTEDGTDRVDQWQTDGTPSIEPAGSSFIAGLTAIDGKNLAVMNHPGDHIYQSQTGLSWVTGDPYLFSFYAGRTSTDNPINSHCLFQIKDASGTVLISQTIPIISPSKNYDYFSFPFTMPSNASGYYVYFDGPDSPSDLMGLCVDAVQLFDTANVYQDGWVTEQNGSAIVENVDWVHTGTPGVDSYDGSYSVQVEATMPSSSSDSNNYGVLPPRQSPITCQAGRDYIMSGWVKLVSNDAGTTIQAKTCYYWWGTDSNGNNSYGEKYGVAQTLVPGVWTYLNGLTQEQVADNVNSIRPVMRIFGGNCTVLFDAMMMQDSGILASAQYTSGPNGTNPFVDTGNLTYTVRSDDPRLGNTFYTGGPTSAPYYGSIAEYGLLYNTLSESTLLTIPELYAYADAYFKTNAIPYTRPTVVRLGDSTVYSIGDTVQLEGVYASALQAPILPIVRIQEQYDGILKTTLELQVEQPDLSLILRKIFLQNQGLYGYSGNPNSSGGSASTNGSNINPTGIPGGPSDHMVQINGSDTNPGYLDSKVGVDGVSPLTIADVSGVRTFGMPAATDANAGYLSQSDHAALSELVAAVPLKFITLTTLGGDLQGTLPSPTLVSKGPGAGTYGSSTQYPIITLDVNGRVTSVTLQTVSGGGGGGGTGTVTSVALAVPSSLLTVSGSPITVSGTFTVTLNTQSPNQGLFGPASGGTSAAPTFRNIVAADLPTNGTIGAGTYGSSSQYPVVTVDAYGRVTSITLVTPAYPVTSVAGRTGVVTLSYTDISGLGTAATQNSTAFDTAGAAAAAQSAAIASSLQKASNLSDLANASTARTNLGLGTAATVNVPASGNASSTQAVLGSDTRLGTGSVSLSSTTPTTDTVTGAGAVGTGTTAARSDHSHPGAPVFVASGTTHAAGFVPDPGSTAGTTRFLREDATFAVALQKRRISLTMYPASITADTVPNTTQTYRLPKGTNNASSNWKLMTATLRVETPNTSATTAQLYYTSNPGNAGFGTGTAALSSALSVSGTSSYEVSTTAFTGTLGSTGLASGSILAPQFSALGGSNVSLETEWEEV